MAWLQGVQAIEGWVDASFYASQVGPLPAGLSAAAHYLRHGWREDRQPHPLFDACFYREACRHAGFATTQVPPLLHFCRHGARAGVLCSPLLEPSWWKRLPAQRRQRQTPSLAAVHPLGSCALELSAHDETQAALLLLVWQSEGLSTEAQRQLTGRGVAVKPTSTIPAGHQLALLQGSLLDWRTHAWLEHIPVSNPNQLETLADPEPIPDLQAPTTLLLLVGPPQQEPLALDTLMAWWRAAEEAAQLIVSDPHTGRLLQGMGVANVTLVEAAPTGNGWLDDSHLLEASEAELGLPPPAGLQPETPIVLGEAGADWRKTLSDRWLALPGWQHLTVATSHQARAQAAWLKRCGTHGHLLVMLNPADPSRTAPALQGFTQQALILEGSFCENSLLKELAWYQQGCPVPELEPTPCPGHQRLWHQERSAASPVQVSVCISLHNYAHTIERALESVRAQTLPGSAVELLVVDDASTDGGATCVQAWMQEHGDHFQRCSLLQHLSNGGLAAARNTAFTHAQAEWCFVLDADNLLHPSALERCLAVAIHTQPTTAVVHPLIATEREQAEGQRIREGLHSIALWQQQRFVDGNHIDAMALVRRSAWQAVGGYQHIPEGWEDFDFWCCLIEAGWHGVCLAQVVCSYVVHNQSMLTTKTNSNLRKLCRLLQHRHPWLNLNPNTTNPNSGVHHKEDPNFRGSAALERM